MAVIADMPGRANATRPFGSCSNAPGAAAIDHDGLVLSRTSLYPVGHLCTPTNTTRCCFPGHPHLVSPERNPHQLHRLERIDRGLVEVVPACRARHTIGDTLGSLTPRRPAGGQEGCREPTSGGRA